MLTTRLTTFSLMQLKRQHKPIKGYRLSHREINRMAAKLRYPHEIIFDGNRIYAALLWHLVEEKKRRLDIESFEECRKVHKETHTINTITWRNLSTQERIVWLAERLECDYGTDDKGIIHFVPPTEE